MLRLGAVSYLNTGPLVYGLDEQTDRFQIRFDVPSQCATLLHENRVDLGLIPSIEYLLGDDYRIVPGVSIASDGPVASVALFTKVPKAGIRSIALDSASRTSVTLLKILCARSLEIDPAFATMPADMDTMLAAADAALVIGDNALFADHDALGLEKIDLGDEWARLTGLPFVYAFWAGRPGIVSASDIRALNDAPVRGIPVAERVAAAYFPNDLAKIQRGADYLRTNMRYALGEREVAGLRRFYELAAELRLVRSARAPEFY
jgi:chorismate dehydratase